MNTSDLHFVEAGKGEITLVFLHYFAGSSKSWESVIDELNNDFHCVAIDLRGFGHSPAPDKALSVNENADDVIKLIQVLELKKFVLVGHSMGGKIAVAIASKKPEGLVSLILVAPSPPTPEPMEDSARKDLLNAFGNRFAITNLIKKITAKPLGDVLFEETVQDQLQASYFSWNGWVEEGSLENISSSIQEVEVPVLIVSGASDPNFSTLFLREEFIKYFPSASFEEIKETGHLIPIEQPLALAKSIQDFIPKQ